MAASIPDPAPLQIQCFGPFAVRAHGRPLASLRTRKGEWLLALLVLRAGHKIEREWLAGTLWPDSGEQNALANLRNSLKDLRRVLGLEAWRLSAPTTRSLSLDLAGATVDVLAFDAALARGDSASLEEAVALYRGPLLEGCTEEWAFEERQLREHAYLTALETLAACALAARDPAGAEGYLRRAVAADPLRETAQRVLMQVLAASGNYAAALTAYRDLRLRLRRDLSLEPDPETQAFFQQLRAEARGKAGDRGQRSGVSMVNGGDHSAAGQDSAGTDPLPLSPVPSGTVTFLFTDIQGSTRLWEQHPAAMRDALARHDLLIESAIVAHDGHVFKRMGDQCCAAFAAPPDALAAALAGQRSLTAEPWGPTGALRVRMALHTGTVEARDGDYLGPPLNRVARLMAAAHGEQVLLSLGTAELVRDQLPEGVSLRDLGVRRLQDLTRPEQIFQLVAPGLPVEFPPLRSLEAFPHNLPLQLTRFIGREEQMAEVAQWLTEHRLVTLTGAGGSGKTRLALQVAAGLLEEYGDGVWLVELAALSDPGLVPQAVASALGVREQPGCPLTATLADTLRARSLLLILDNCEHLLPACAQLAETLLQSCAHLRLLATSREGLRIAGEATYRVPPLSLPGVQAFRRSGVQEHDTERLNARTPERLMQFESVQLFVERARTALPSFLLHDENAAAVARVCHRLDGLPLAIELAAARVKALPVEQINERLDDRFRLLTGGSRTALPRQQTLRALIDWSYDLLSETERALLRRLSVFAGGWTLAAAEAVCRGDSIEEWDVLDLLAGLVEKSLVVYDQGETEARYRLLETIRQYAREKLAEAGECEAVGQRHLDFYLSRAEEADTHLFSVGQTTYRKRLERDHDNLRAALEWSLTWGGGVEAALRLVGALGQFWLMGSHLREGTDWATKALARGRNAPPLVLARAMNAGWDCAFHCDFELASLLAEEALRYAWEAHDRWTISRALFAVALQSVGRGELEKASASAEEGMALSQPEGDRWLIGRHQIALGLVAWMRGDYAASRPFMRETLEISRELADEWSIAMTLATLGFVTRGDGDYEGARAFHLEGMPLSERLGDRRGIGWHLVGMAGVEVSQGRAERAARLLGAAAAVLEAVGSPLPPFLQREHDHTLEQTAAALGEGAFAAAWAAGQVMSLEEAIRYALEEVADG